MTSSFDPHAPAELQECAGIAWVKFQNSRKPDSEAKRDWSQALRCIGVRTSQPYQNQRLSTTSAGMAKPIHPEGSSDAPGDVTWACAGHVALIIPPEVASAKGVGRRTAPWTQCRFHCNGISVRLDTVPLDDDLFAEPPSRLDKPQSPPMSVEDAGQEEEIDLIAAVTDWSKATASRTEAIARRAGAILMNARTLAEQRSGQELAGDLANASGRILEQSVKITKRFFNPFGGRRIEEEE